MGLLEDAISQGNVDPSMSALFSPGMASGAANIVMNSPEAVGRISSINPSTGRPWGQYEAIYQNNDTAALRRRDEDRAKLLGVIGHLDPDLQSVMLRQFGFTAPAEVHPPNVEGMTPTQAAAAQQRFSEFPSSGGDEGVMGSKLRRQMQLIQFQHALNAPERDRAQALRELQAMASMDNMRSQDLYRRDQINARNEAIKNQKFGALQHISQMITAMAGPGGNPELAKGLQQLASGLVSDLIKGDIAMGGGGPPETTITPNAGNPNRTPLLSELMAQENAGQTNEPPWWDRVVPSSATGTFQPDQKKIAALQAQLDHLAKFAPGDIGAQMAIKRQLQDALIPPAYSGPATGGSNISAPAGAVRKVR